MQERCWVIEGVVREDLSKMVAFKWDLKDEKETDIPGSRLEDGNR